MKADLFWIGFLTAFAGFVITEHFVSMTGTFWDNAFFYSIFWNQLDALHRYGEPAWWFPGNQFGWPAFYYSMLGDVPCITPVFALFGLFAWVCGRVGADLNYYFLYTLYYGYLVPGLVSLAGYYVLRLFIKSRPALWFAMVLTAFSPGVMVNMSDIGFLEPLIYSLFFLGCWLRFLREPDPKRFWLLALSVCMLSFSINYPFLMFNFHFLPVVVVLSIFGIRGGKGRFVSAVRSIRTRDWAVALSVAFICAIPSFTAFRHAGNFIRQSLKTGLYDFRALKAGNPLELFGVGLPSLGFEWKDGLWILKAASYDTWIAYSYMGILCLPLAICGLLYGVSWVRKNILIMIVVLAAFITFSAQNPVLSLLIRNVKALQTNDHWSDLGFRSGAYIVLIALAAMGFDILARGNRRAARTLQFLIAGFFAVAVAVFVSYKGTDIFGLNVFGLLCLLTALMLVASVWLWRSINGQRRKTVLGVLLFLAVVDVSSFTALHMRSVVNHFGNKIIMRAEKLETDSMGLHRMARYGIGDMADHILKLRPHFEMMEGELFPWLLWPFGLFTQVRIEDPVPLAENVKREIARLNEKADYLLPLDPEFEKHPEFAPFVNAVNAPRPDGAIETNEVRYNELRLTVKSTSPAVLFVRDAFYPGWSATVNEKPVAIARALFNSKAIVVPAGESRVHFKFSPGPVKWSLLVAYLAFSALIAYNVWLWRRAP